MDEKSLYAHILNLSGVVSGKAPKFCGTVDEKILIGGDAAAGNLLNNALNEWKELPLIMRLINSCAIMG